MCALLCDPGIVLHIHAALYTLDGTAICARPIPTVHCLQISITLLAQDFALLPMNGYASVRASMRTQRYRQIRLELIFSSWSVHLFFCIPFSVACLVFNWCNWWNNRSKCHCLLWNVVASGRLATIWEKKTYYSKNESSCAEERCDLNRIRALSHRIILHMGNGRICFGVMENPACGDGEQLWEPVSGKCSVEWL